MFCRCKCLLQLGRIQNAQSSFDEAIDAIDRSGLKKTMRKGIATDLQEAFINLAKTVREDEEAEKKANTSCTYIPDEYMKQLDPVVPLPAWAKIKERHPKFPAASR